MDEKKTITKDLYDNLFIAASYCDTLLILMKTCPELMKMIKDKCLDYDFEKAEEALKQIGF